MGQTRDACQALRYGCLREKKETHRSCWTPHHYGDRPYSELQVGRETQVSVECGVLLGTFVANPGRLPVDEILLWVERGASL